MRSLLETSECDSVVNLSLPWDPEGAANQVVCPVTDRTLAIAIAIVEGLRSPASQLPRQGKLARVNCTCLR